MLCGKIMFKQKVYEIETLFYHVTYEKYLRIKIIHFVLLIKSFEKIQNGAFINNFRLRILR
jgi:hypothetical protein